MLIAKITDSDFFGGEPQYIEDDARYNVRGIVLDKNGTSIKYNKQIADGKEGTPREQAIEQEKRDRNEVNSIYYENIVREKEGYPQRGYNYSAGD